MDKLKSVVELALAIRFKLISDLSDSISTSEMKSISAADRKWLAIKAEELLKKHGGSFTKAVSSLDLPPAVHQDLVNQITDRCADEGSTKKKEALPTDHSSGDDQTRTYAADKQTQFSSRYRILEKCGSGGLGEVFLAEDRQLKRIVALKKIRTECIDSELALARFQTEAEITGGLQHPSIAPVYSFETDESGSPYYTMRFIDGESLSQKIRKSHNLSGEERKSWLRQQVAELVKVIHAVEFAHSQGVIHRDIKPSNIMVGKFGESFLVDWGLARSNSRRPNIQVKTDDDNGSLLTRSFSPKDGEDQQLTKLGDVVGTPAFMSPEQTLGDTSQVGFESDIYSLGATLFALVKGVPPFNGYSQKQVISKLSAGESPIPGEQDTSFPKDLRSICRKSMAARPSERYSCASELRQDLQNWLDDEPVSVARDSFWTKLRRFSRKNFKAMFAIATSVVLGLGVLAVGLVVSYAQNKELVRLNDQLKDANEEVLQAQDVAQKHFQNAQAVVGEFLVMVTEHKALKNGPAGVQAFRKVLLEKAQTYYQRFLADSLSQKRTVVESVDALEKLASIQNELGEFEECFSKCEEAIRLLESVPKEVQSKPDLRELKASLLRLKGESQSYLGQSNDARKSYEESIAIRQDLLQSGEADPLTAKHLAWTKNSLALLLSDDGEFAEADQLISSAFEQSPENETKTLGSQKEKLQFFLTSSQIKFLGGNRSESSRLLERGIQLAKELLSEFPKEYEVMEYLAAFEQDLASNLNSEGKPNLAKPHIGEAIRIREKLNQIGESNFENEWYLATAFRLLAEINCNLRQYEIAARDADRAIEKIQRLLVQENKNQKTRASLASAYRTRGKIHGYLGRTDESHFDYESAIQVIREDIEQQGGSEQLLHSLAQTLHNFGRAIEGSNPSKALSLYMEAAEIIEGLASQSSPRPKVFEDVVIILGSHGQLTGETRSYSEGIRILEKRADIAKKAFALTGQEKFKDSWVWCMNDVAQAFSENGQLDKSMKWFDDCRKLWETFSDEYKKTESYAQGFGGTLVNGSIALRKRAEYPKAMEWLDKAESLMGPFAEKETSGPYVKRFYAFAKKCRARLLGEMASKLDYDSDPRQLDQALNLLDQADNADSQNVSNLSLKANLLIRKSQPELAIETLKRLEGLVSEKEKKTIRRKIAELQKNGD